MPLALTAGEALGLLMSYEAFLCYAQSPFSGESRSAVTKIRATLPPDVARELERLHRHVAISARPLGDPAPLLGELLQAALDAMHLRIVYHSRSGISERAIFPFGLYAADGCWYCACHDERRDAHISLRADRVLSLARVAGRDRRPHIPLDRWLATVEWDVRAGPAASHCHNPARHAQPSPARPLRPDTPGRPGQRHDRGDHPRVRDRVVRDAATAGWG